MHFRAFIIAFKTEIWTTEHICVCF